MRLMLHYVLLSKFWHCYYIVLSSFSPMTLYKRRVFFKCYIICMSFERFDLKWNKLIINIIVLTVIVKIPIGSTVKRSWWLNSNGLFAIFHEITGFGVPATLHVSVTLSPSATLVTAGKDCMKLGGSADIHNARPWYGLVSICMGSVQTPCWLRHYNIGPTNVQLKLASYCA